MAYPIEMANSARKRRSERNLEFGIFISLAECWFKEIASQDPRHEILEKMYDFYVVPGGKNGAVDKRELDVFFGKRPIESVTEIRQGTGQNAVFPIRANKFVTEAGAELRYRKTEHGTVLCLLTPARSEGSRQREDSIILAHIKEPRSLTGKPLLERHWRSLISYLECSSLDGDPRVVDRIRVWWLQFSRPMIVEGKYQGRRILHVGGEIIKWALTIGLSGAVLEAVRLIATALQHGS